MAKIKDIVKAKLMDKSKLGDWYQKRLEICETCPLNSKNFKPQTLEDKVRFHTLSAASLGKDFCWKCGCTLVDLASLKESECEEGKWKAILNEDIMEGKDFNIYNLSPEKVTLRSVGNEFQVVYGKMPYQADTIVYLKVSPTTEEDFINLKASASCGCTTPTVTREGKDLKIKIEYDSKRIGDFDKLVTVDYTSNKRGQIRIRIKGEITLPQ